MTKLPYVVMTVECTNCQHEQKVHVRAGEKFAQVVEQTVVCEACRKPFGVTLPDEIVSAEFVSYGIPHLKRDS
jgi:hypothetical protein